MLRAMSLYMFTRPNFRVPIHKHSILPLTYKKKNKPSNESVFWGHLFLICNNILSFDKLTIFAHGQNNYILEIKERLLIIQDKPVLYKNISSIKWSLFGHNYNLNRFFVW